MREHRTPPRAKAAREPPFGVLDRPHSGYASMAHNRNFGNTVIVDRAGKIVED
jgi:hypothetical protein